MDDLLKIELQVLLLRYGRGNVIKALAIVSNETPEEIEKQLSLAETLKARRKDKKRTPSSVELVAKIANEKPDSAGMLQAIAARFDAGAFLPHLRDVERFLDRAGYPHGRLKSRREAARQVVKVLSQYSIEDLKRLLSSEGQGDSDYSRLAREIMGGRRKITLQD